MWPESAIILDRDCIVSGHVPNVPAHLRHSITTDRHGYPITMKGWVDLAFEHSLARKEVWTIIQKLHTYFLANHNVSILYSSEGWSDRRRLYYNTAIAMLGYTEGQEQDVLDEVNRLKTDIIFQKLWMEVYLTSDGYHVPRTMQENAKEKTRPKGPPPVIHGKGKSRR